MTSGEDPLRGYSGEDNLVRIPREDHDDARLLPSIAGNAQMRCSRKRSPLVIEIQETGRGNTLPRCYYES